jgi:hypothetical protein
MHLCSFHIFSYKASEAFVFSIHHTKGVILLFTRPRVSAIHTHFTHNSGYRFRRTHHQAVKELVASLRQNSVNQSIIKPIFITILYKRTRVYCMSPYKKWAVNITINTLAISTSIKYLFMVYLPETRWRSFWIAFWWRGRVGSRGSDFESRIERWLLCPKNFIIHSRHIEWKRGTHFQANIHCDLIIPCYITTARFTLMIILKT